MPGDETVTCWLRQLEIGDQDAARHLWQRYYRELVELARARLSTTPRRVSDEEDVALSVFRSLYDGAARGQFAAVVSRGDLTYHAAGSPTYHPEITVLGGPSGSRVVLPVIEGQIVPE